jgi:hypothetical protein
MNGPDAAGPPPFEASATLRRLRVTVMDMRTMHQHRHCERSEAIQSVTAARL